LFNVRPLTEKEGAMDWFDDFEDDFEGDDYEESSEEDESEEDEFKARDAFLTGASAGFGYEEGLERGKRRRRKRFEDEDL
jgi:hypothetical protein